MMADFTDLNDVIVDGVVQASGKLKGGQQATEQGDAVLLGSDLKIPASMYDQADTSGFVTASDVNSQISSALGPYPTETEVTNQISTALEPYPTQAEVTSQIEQAVADAGGTEVVAGTGLEFSGTTLNHSNSVSARTSNLGSSTSIPIIRYDAQGHITYSSSATVYPPTSAGRDGQYWCSDGSGAGRWTTPDTTPTNGSDDLITSGGVYSALQDFDVDMSDFYTKSEVDAMAQAFNKWDVQFVEELPGTGTTGVMYMVPSSDGSYSEQYVWTGSNYVKVGNTSMTGRWVDQGAPSEVVFEEGAKYRIWFYDGCAQFCYIKIPGLLSDYSISPDNSRSSYPSVYIDESTNKISRVNISNGITSFTGEYIFIEKWVGE